MDLICPHWFGRSFRRVYLDWFKNYIVMRQNSGYTSQTYSVIARQSPFKEHEGGNATSIYFAFKAGRFTMAILHDPKVGSFTIYASSLVLFYTRPEKPGYLIRPDVGTISPSTAHYKKTLFPPFLYWTHNEQDTSLWERKCVTESWPRERKALENRSAATNI